MAEKKITQIPQTTQEEEKNEPVKPIILRDSETGSIYVLQFSRDSVRFAEQRGFDISVFERTLLNVTANEDLFYYAFRMHHPKITQADTTKFLYEKLCGFPEGMLLRLIELYMDTVGTMTRQGNAEKNVTMTAEF